MKRMQALIALLLVCGLLLVGCGKKAEAEGSGSAAAEETTQTDKKTDKKADKTTKSDQDQDDQTGSAAESGSKPSATSAPAATAAGTNKAAATAKPTTDPVQTATEIQNGESGTWDDVEQAQQDLINNLAINIVGNWQDSGSQRASMIIDEQGSATILWSQDAATTYFWTFSVDVDSDTGEMTYSDCVKQIQANNEAPRVLYQNGTGKLVLRDGSIYWLDDIENAGAQSVFIKIDN